MNRYNDEVNKTLSAPKIAQTLHTQGIVPRNTTAAEFKAFVEAESRKFGHVIERANIKLAN
jgi:tripartite-type tricarboxylate transporter receptor subunit TctC